MGAGGGGDPGGSFDRFWQLVRIATLLISGLLTAAVGNQALY